MSYVLIIHSHQTCLGRSGGFVVLFLGRFIHGKEREKEGGSGYVVSPLFFVLLLSRDFVASSHTCARCERLFFRTGLRDRLQKSGETYPEIKL